MALYNNGYPATYQQMYPVYSQQNAPAPQSGINWIQGEAAAKAYLVAPNCTVQLWDSQEQVIYLKSADASGMPSMKVLDYTIRDLDKNGASKALKHENDKDIDYATKEEIRAVSDRITAIQKQMDSITKELEGKRNE